MKKIVPVPKFHLDNSIFTPWPVRKLHGPYVPLRSAPQDVAKSSICLYNADSVFEILIPDINARFSLGKLVVSAE